MEGQTNKERKVFSSKKLITKLTFENIYLRVAVSFNIHLKVFRLRSDKQENKTWPQILNANFLCQSSTNKGKKKKGNVYFLFET